MTPHSSTMTLAMPAPTDPKEVIRDSALLAHRAQEEQGRRPRPEKTSPNERAFARAAIFTAVNALETFIIDLAQERIKTPGFCACCAHRINDDLLQQRANLSKTIGEWPVVLGVGTVTDKLGFENYEEIRLLRNNLTHPKFEPLKPSTPTQDQLLDLTNGDKAKWVVEEVGKMLAALCTAFSLPIPPEFSNPFGEVASR